MDSARVTAICIAFLGFTSFACSTTGSNEGDDGGPGGDGDEETTNYDEGEGIGDGECADVCGTPGCGSCPTIAMVDGGGFMIGVGEVTNAQYAGLLEVEFDAAALPGGCAWKSSFEPQGWSDQLDPSLPVVGVDWCDAAMFCTWSGGQLCGAVGGGPADWDAAEDGDGDMWYRACSDGGTKLFPYGTSYAPAACNGGDAGQAGLTSVGSFPDCEGGVAGLFDMSGNVWEWTNACEDPQGDANTQCRRRGGSRFSDADNLRCSVNSRRARGDRDNAVGFRCCSE